MERFWGLFIIRAKAFKKYIYIKTAVSYAVFRDYAKKVGKEGTYKKVIQEKKKFIKIWNTDNLPKAI